MKSFTKYLINCRCRLDGIMKQVTIDSKSRFNRSRMILGLGEICGTKEYPVRIRETTIAGNIKICYGTSLLNCELNTSNIGEVELGRFINAHHMKISVGDAKVSIGSFCSIAASSIVMTGHFYDGISTYYLKRHVLHETDQSEVAYKNKNLTIGNDVWIGENVIIIGVSKIGNGAIIGAGSVVTKDIEPFAVYAGNPAKFIKWRFPREIIDQLEDSRWWDLDIDQIKIIAAHSTDPIKEVLKSIKMVEGYK